MKHSPVKIILLASMTALLSVPGCRDRDTLLSPSGESGWLKLSVEFASEESKPAGENTRLSDEETKRKAQESKESTRLASGIIGMDAEAYDGSQGGLVSLGAGTIDINWVDSSFSGTK